MTSPQRTPTSSTIAWRLTHLAIAVTLAVSTLQSGLTRRGGRLNERGEIEQNVIVWGLMAAAAIGIATIVAAKFTGLANSIPTK